MENNNNISKSDTLDELNEYFNDENSDRKLSEFFMRKRKGPPSKGSLFGNIPMPCFDLKVKLLKRKKSPPRTEKDMQGAEIDPKLIVSVLEEVPTVKISANRPQSVNSTQQIPAPAELIASHQTTNVSKSPLLENVPPHIGSARSIYGRSLQRRSGAASDLLRRSAIRRRSKSANCRNLLTEFENSPEYFLPRVCSTPACVSGPHEAIVLEHSPPLSSVSASNASTESEPLMHTLQRQDKQLRELLEGALEKTFQKAQEISATRIKTPSPSFNPTSDSQRGHTYTVEKGSKPGQVILTPTKNTSEHVTSLNIQPSESAAALKYPKVRVRNISIDQMTAEKDNHAVDEIVVLDTPPNKNPNRSDFAETIRKSQVFIPETQEIPAMMQPEQLINSLQRTGSPTVVVLPMYQTFNTTPKSLDIGNIEFQQKTTEETPIKATTNDTQKDTKCGQKDKSDDMHNQVANTNKSIQTSDIVFQKRTTCLAELAELLTDDESEEEPQRLEASSSAPLNLHVPDRNLTPINGRQKNLRRRHAISSNKSPDYVLNLRRQAFSSSISKNRLRRKLQPLNKAPSTPINGEKFAKELIQLTNYEILDLRKRNSMGKVFPLCWHKSKDVDEERVLENQLELEQKLALEIARRNFTGESFNFPQEVDGSQQESMLPAPAGFNDISESQFDFPETQVSKTSLRRGSRNLPMTETLRNYLNAPISVKNRKKSTDYNKRSLYTKGTSDSEENQTSLRENITQRPSQNNIETVHSPPYSRALRLSEVRVVPPPPPSLLQTTFSHTRNKNDHDNSQALNNDGAIHSLSLVSNRNTATNTSSSSFKQSSEIRNTRQSHAVATSTAEMLPVASGGEHEPERQMESLRLDTLTPSVEVPENTSHFAETSSDNENVQNTIRTVHSTSNKLKHIVNDGELASTSKAALKCFKSTPSNDEVIFKKPLPPAAKKSVRPARKARKVEEQLADTASASDSSVRRSKRVHVPFQNGRTLLFQMLSEREWGKRLDKAVERHNQKKENSRVGGVSAVSTTCNSEHPICTSTPINTLEQAPYKQRPKDTNNKNPKGRQTLRSSKESDNTSSSKAEEAKNTKKFTRSKSKSAQKRNQTKQNNEQNRSVEESRMPVQDINAMFDRLKGGSPNEATLSEQEMRSTTRAELTTENDFANCSKDAEVPMTSAAATSQNELITWLTVGVPPNSVNLDNEVLAGMHISSRSNLTFTDLEGIDYAFYATEEKASLGYMRFKPKQKRPPKRAKTYNLHFVVFSGRFVIKTCTDPEHRDHSRILIPGDMVVIQKGAHYTIDNVDDDISILMVVKK